MRAATARCGEVPIALFSGQGLGNVNRVVRFESCLDALPLGTVKGAANATRGSSIGTIGF